jgi:ubiquitin-protein ligase
MSFNAKQIKKWEKTMEKKFQVEQKNSDFKIVKVDINSLNKYYILLQLTGGHYKGHTYILEMITRQDKNILYPHTPPLIKFLNKIWHPNVYGNGDICLDILKGGKAWSPANSIGAVVSNIILLLDNPENSDAANGQAATTYRVCEKQYDNIPKHILEDSIKRQEMYDLCYKSYDEKTKNFAGKNIENYLTYFTVNDGSSKDI